MGIVHGCTIVTIDMLFCMSLTSENNTMEDRCILIL